MSFFQPLYEGYGQAQSLKTQASQYEDQAKVTAQQSNANEEIMRRRVKMQTGGMRASAAESGFDSSSGSMADLLTHSAGEAELDILTERYKAELQGIGLRNEATSLRKSASNVRKEAAFKFLMKAGETGAKYGGGMPVPGG